MMVKSHSADFNRFLDVTVDICSVSDSTMESELFAKHMGDVIEENFVYMEHAQNQTVDYRAGNVKEPSIFDDRHVHVRTALIREKREEKPRAYNYNLRTGRIRRWY